jgi:hypothetical protein
LKKTKEQKSEERWQIFAVVVGLLFTALFIIATQSMSAMYVDRNYETATVTSTPLVTLTPMHITSTPQPGVIIEDPYGSTPVPVQ